MFKRDDYGLKRAKRDNAYMLVVSLDGKIAGYYKYSIGVRVFNTRYFASLKKRMLMMNINEYEWMTDETRETKITTAADLYDKIEWTSKGFKIEGENLPLN